MMLQTLGEKVEGENPDVYVSSIRAGLLSNEVGEGQTRRIQLRAQWRG